MKTNFQCENTDFLRRKIYAPGPYFFLIYDQVGTLHIVSADAPTMVKSHVVKEQFYHHSRQNYSLRQSTSPCC